MATKNLEVPNCVLLVRTARVSGKEKKKKKKGGAPTSITAWGGTTSHEQIAQKKSLREHEVKYDIA